MIQRFGRCAILFHIDGEPYARKTWSFVPYRGDEVMLHVEGGDKAPFRVTRVVWGVEGPDGHDLGMQAVNIDLKRIIDDSIETEDDYKKEGVEEDEIVLRLADVIRARSDFRPFTKTLDVVGWEVVREQARDLLFGYAVSITKRNAT